MQKTIGNATNEHIELFSNADGDRIVSRWVTRGTNEGVFGLPADGKPVAFTGIAIWRVANGRLAECWVERAALEFTTASKRGAERARWRSGQRKRLTRRAAR